MIPYRMKPYCTFLPVMYVSITKFTVGYLIIELVSNPVNN